MIVLTTTTDNIKAVLGGSVTTNQMRCFSSWRDITTTAYTPGRTAVLTNNTTAVNIVPAPLTATQRVADLISIRNNDTVQQTLTVTFDDNGTGYTLWSGILLSGETLIYADGKGWQRLGSGGVEALSYPASPTDSQVFTATGAGGAAGGAGGYPGGGGGGGGSANTTGIAGAGGAGGRGEIRVYSW